MRVTGGEARGRALKTLKGLATRPTASKVREAIFNVLADRVSGSQWLDLCAGSGIMSIEALSRGAESVTLVEQSSAAIAIIRDNLKLLGFEARATLIRQDVIRYLNQKPTFFPHFIYFDPPYQSNLYHPVMEAIVRQEWLSQEAVLVTEHASRLIIPSCSELSLIRELKYGDTMLSLWQHR